MMHEIAWCIIGFITACCLAAGALLGMASVVAEHLG